ERNAHAVGGVLRCLAPKAERERCMPDAPDPLEIGHVHVNVSSIRLRHNHMSKLAGHFRDQMMIVTYASTGHDQLAERLASRRSTCGQGKEDKDEEARLLAEPPNNGVHHHLRATRGRFGRFSRLSSRRTAGVTYATFSRTAYSIVSGVMSSAEVKLATSCSVRLTPIRSRYRLMIVAICWADA